MRALPSLQPQLCPLAGEMQLCSRVLLLGRSGSAPQLPGVPGWGCPGMLGQRVVAPPERCDFPPGLSSTDWQLSCPTCSPAQLG